MIDLDKAKENIKNITKCNSVIECRKVIKEINDNVGLYDSPKELKNNDDYILLKNYLSDSNSILAMDPAAPVESLINYCLPSTLTDVITYLENFVYDDTEYESVEQYISSDFKNPEDFRVHLIKNYFLNNFEYYLKNL